MNDIVIIGGGVSGRAIAERYAKSGSTIVIIERDSEKSEQLAQLEKPNVTVFHGDATFAGRNLVAILDPHTADEKRLIPAGVIIIATGNRAGRESHHQLLGIAKLGIQSDPNSNKIKTNTSGLTRCENIYAVGDCSDFEDWNNLTISFPSPVNQ